MDAHFSGRSQTKIINNVISGGPPYLLPAHLSFGQYAIDRIKHFAEEDSVVLINGATGHETTYKQVLRNVVSVATGLKRIGVQKGDIVAICSENTDEFIFTVLGIACCGAIANFINVQYTNDELSHAINLSKPSIVFCSEGTLKKYGANLKTWSFIKKIIQFNGESIHYDAAPYNSILVDANVEEFEAEEVEGVSDTACILYSSGTTGLPKGVMLTHVNILYPAAYAEYRMACNPEANRVLTILPWYHGYGLLTTLGFVLNGKIIVYFNGLDEQKYLKAIEQYKIEMLLTVPPIMVVFAKSAIVDKFDMSSVKVIWSCAATLREETIKQIVKRFPNCYTILQVYGLTEGSTITSDIDDGSTTIKFGSVGKVVEGSKLKIVDVDTRQKLGIYQKGEICVKVHSIMKGYLNNPAATCEAFDEEGFLKTGDIGYYDENGYLYVVDRIKEIFKYKGKQISPATVETALLEHSEVAECGVVGAPDDLAGELPTAFVVLKPGSKVTEQELIDFTSARLSSSHRLRGGVIFVNEIPKNQAGKILRRMLKAKLLEMRG